MGRLKLYSTNAERQRAYRKRLKRSVHFQSATGLWSIPQALFDELDAEFHFTLDVCALPANAKCPVILHTVRRRVETEMVWHMLDESTVWQRNCRVDKESL
jgi:hypothetical protein